MLNPGFGASWNYFLALCLVETALDSLGKTVGYTGRCVKIEKDSCPMCNIQF